MPRSVYFPKTAAPRKRIVLPIAWTLLAVALSWWAPPASAAPLGWTAFGGWYTDGTDDFMLGAGARISAASITVIPNGEWIFVDSGSSYTLNLDATLSVLPMGVASGFVGAGLGLFTFDPDAGDSNTDSVVNAIVGVGLNAVPLKPYAQLKYVFRDGDDPLVFSIGARF
jgi:hypothetical protein